MFLLEDRENQCITQEYGPFFNYKLPPNSPSFLRFEYRTHIHEFDIPKRIKKEVLQPYHNKLTKKDIDKANKHLKEAKLYTLSGMPETRKYCCLTITCILMVIGILTMFGNLPGGFGIIVIALIGGCIYYTYYKCKVYNPVMEKLKKRESEFKQIIEEMNHTTFLEKPFKVVMGRYGCYLGFVVAQNALDRPNVQTYEAWARKNVRFIFYVEG